jgi:septal ring factor EnvC (AmiA/AmiB activator)
MAVEIPKEVMDELSHHLNSVTNRIRNIQQKADETGKEIIDREIRWNKDIEDFNYKISLTRKEVDSMKKEFASYLSDLRHVIEKFRLSARKNAFDEFSQKVDEINFEKLVTKKQFERLLDEG